jgi:hypothetical protein
LLPIRHLLAVLAIVGLILTPIARPMMAIAAEMPAAMDEHAAMEMPGDMPCCPKQAPMPDCAKDCLFMAMCAAQFACNPMQGAGLVMPLGLAGIFVPVNDATVAGVSHGPPPRPPKI